MGVPYTYTSNIAQDGPTAVGTGFVKTECGDLIVHATTYEGRVFLQQAVIAMNRKRTLPPI